METETESGRQGEGLRREIRSLDGRDLQLWSIGVLISLVVAAGFVALVWPNMMWHLGELRLEGQYLPQLIFGFVVLIVLFNIYVLHSRRSLLYARDELVRQVLRTEAAERLSLVDSLTETFARRYLDYVLLREVSRADRRGSSLAFLLCEVDNLKSVNTRFGHLVGDEILVAVAALLKKTFRASDTVIRYGGDEFLVVMDNADERAAKIAFARLLTQVDKWNQMRAMEGYKLRLGCGIAAYSKGANILGILETVEDRLYQQKLNKIVA